MAAIGIPGLQSLLSQSSADGSVGRPRSGRLRTSTVVCQAQERRGVVPKLESFNRRFIDRLIEDPSLVQKTENDLAEYCCGLEGDESHSCWRAYFELKDLEGEMPREDIEQMIREAGGVKNLVSWVHGVTEVQKDKRNAAVENPSVPTDMEEVEETPRPFPIPDGIPKSQEELDDDLSALMPDSDYTRLLRRRGTMPAWFTLAPDHETD